MFHLFYSILFCSVPEINLCFVPSLFFIPFLRNSFFFQARNKEELNELEKKLDGERESKLRAMVGSGSTFSNETEMTIENKHEKNLDALLYTRTIVSTRCCAIKARTSYKLLQENYNAKRLLIFESHSGNTPHNKDWLFEEEIIRKRKLAEKLSKNGKAPPMTNSPMAIENEKMKVKMFEESLAVLDDEYVLAVQTLYDELIEEKKSKDFKEDLIREKWLRNPVDVITETEIQNLQNEFDVEMKENETKFDLFTIKCQENCEREKQQKKNRMDMIEMKKLNEKSPLSDFLLLNMTDEERMKPELDKKDVSELISKEINCLDESCKQLLINDTRILNKEKTDILTVISLSLSWSSLIDYRSLQSSLHQKILERTYREGGKYLPAQFHRTHCIDFIFVTFFSCNFIIKLFHVNEISFIA